jgi:alanyl-tRNA synthetase
VDIILDSTPFYAESGGQVSDHGSISSQGGSLATVDGVRKAAGGRLFLHAAHVQSGTLRVGEKV